MEVAHLIFLIPIVAILAGIIGNYLKHREKMHAVQAKSDPQKEQRLQRLEERVRVLERIVTDRGHSLSDEISALRD